MDEVFLLCLMDSLTMLSLMESSLNKSRKKFFHTEPARALRIEGHYEVLYTTPHHNKTLTQTPNHPTKVTPRPKNTSHRPLWHRNCVTLLHDCDRYKPSLPVRAPLSRITAGSRLVAVSHELGRPSDHPDPLGQQARSWSNTKSLDPLS